MLRSPIAAGFPLFTKQMFKNMGVQWAGTLLCIAAMMIPIPLAFRIYGPSLGGASSSGSLQPFSLPKGMSRQSRNEELTVIDVRLYRINCYMLSTGQHYHCSRMGGDEKGRRFESIVLKTVKPVCRDLK